MRKTTGDSGTHLYFLPRQAVPMVMVTVKVTGGI